MNKKFYQVPVVESFVIETTGFMCASVTGAVGGGSDGGIIPDVDNPSDPGWGSDF